MKVLMNGDRESIANTLNRDEDLCPAVKIHLLVAIGEPISEEMYEEVKKKYNNKTIDEIKQHYKVNFVDKRNEFVYNYAYAKKGERIAGILTWSHPVEDEWKLNMGVEDLYVLPEFRKQKVATKLMKKMMTATKNRPRKKLDFRCYGMDDLWLGAFYEELGFKLCEADQEFLQEVKSNPMLKMIWTFSGRMMTMYMGLDEPKKAEEEAETEEVFNKDWKPFKG